MAPMKFLGVDGCRGGWLAAIISGSRVHTTVYNSIEMLWRDHGNAATIMIDIPIGLPGPDMEPRKAEALARKILGLRHACVFTPGVRDGLECRTYAAASELNRKLTGKKLTKQYWNIMPKIKAVDSFFDATPEAVAVFREAHPEVCFEMADPGKIGYAKKSGKGLRERLAALCKHINNIEDIYGSTLARYRRSEVARDDILDALILAVTAKEGNGVLRSLPDPPQRDGKGLPMAIWYHDFTAGQ